ncbi:hypothetical protein DL764_005908 [Monosporascus ibericus]|uniref:protein disulfide-isomerase n=1 Tax=Monosporascus ibericus TaxID=155417 RepID=A0A4Q4T6Y0_9PEZI|nr:hypothetical protein DL764_005908 [Monosporascus ibericus]
MHTFHTTIAVAAVALLSALPTASAAGLYTKNSPVLQVDAKSYDRLIAKSNHTSVVEFYAPWCGHCQNLKPAYEKAAKNLEGLAKVAAVNCDDDDNKQLCGMMGVKGFPTLKTVRPGKKPGSKPIVEDYQGQRTAKAIVDAVVDKINNHVKRVTDKDIDQFLETEPEKPKAILFTEKGTTSALLRSIAIDFLDVISIAQVRNKEAKANEKFNVNSYPTLVLIPGGGKENVVYDGEMKKDAIVEFLSQAGEPNPDPAPAKSKGDKKAEKKDKKPSEQKEPSDSAAEPTESADVPPTVNKPIITEAALPIPAITQAGKLAKECLNKKSKTCVLAFVPSAHGEAAEKALNGLSEIAFKYAQGKHHLFPFYEVHTDSDEPASLLKSLDVSGEVVIVALNGKKGWWRQYEGDFSRESIESWIDAIRLNEGTKKKLPEGVIGETPVEEETVEVKVEESVEIKIDPETETETPTKGAEPAPKATAAEHNEL